MVEKIAEIAERSGSRNTHVRTPQRHQPSDHFQSECAPSSSDFFCYKGWPQAVGLNPVCNETKYPGPCAGYFPRYYYNNVTKTCEKFIYGGCHANGNNFVTLDECQNTCWVAPPQECTYPADAGPCEAYMPRFFYNTLTKACEQFVYGGCGGNANNFLTFDACEKKCKKVFGVVPRA
ncbi:hypothetical protein MTO96_023060 [Rhipicephalus appendiculatus]